jgi:hypothetical protein
MPVLTVKTLNLTNYIRKYFCYKTLEETYDMIQRWQRECVKPMQQKANQNKVDSKGF